MLMVSFVFTNALDEISIREQRERNCGAPGLCVGLGIVKRDLNFHAPEIKPAETLRYAQLFAMRMSWIVEPALIVKAYSLRHKRVAFPFADRVSKPTGIRFRRKPAAVTENLAIVIDLFVKDDEDDGSLNELEWRVAYKHAIRYSVRNAPLRRSSFAQRIGALFIKSRSPGLERSFTDISCDVLKITSVCD